MSKNKNLISIISPCFNEEDNVALCFEAIRDIFEKELPEYEYEHIFSDNASRDRSVEILADIAEKNPQVKVIVNARNYGPFRSTFNALKWAKGDAILVMLPVDLQDPPELLPQFVAHWADGAKIVYGQRVERDEGLIMRMIRGTYYRVVAKLADIRIPVNTGEFQLIDRQVMDALLKSNDHYPYLRGMIANCGFEDAIKIIPYRWQARRNGKSKNNFFNLIDQGMNGIISFTSVPLRISTFVGFFLAVVSLAYALIQLYINLFVSDILAPAGIPTLIVSIFFFSGVQLFFIGLLGEYIGAIHTQLRRGPMIIERRLINLSEP